MLANPQILARTLQQPIKQQIIIVRHGDTKFNSDGTGERVRGWSNVPLTSRGMKEAADAASKLKGKNIAGMVSSDLVRAQQTALIISKILGIKPEIDPRRGKTEAPRLEFDPRLRTWDVGMYAGGRSEEVQHEIDKYVDHPDQPIPGGESFNQFKSRTFSGVTDAATKHFGRTVLLVTHHSVERVVEAWDKEGQPPDHSICMECYHEKGDKPGGITQLVTSVAALKGQNA